MLMKLLNLGFEQNDTSCSLPSKQFIYFFLIMAKNKDFLNARIPNAFVLYFLSFVQNTYVLPLLKI